MNQITSENQALQGQPYKLVAEITPTGGRGYDIVAENTNITCPQPPAFLWRGELFSNW